MYQSQLLHFWLLSAAGQRQASGFFLCRFQHLPAGVKKCKGWLSTAHKRAKTLFGARWNFVIYWRKSCTWVFVASSWILLLFNVLLPFSAKNKKYRFWFLCVRIAWCWNINLLVPNGLTSVPQDSGSRQRFEQMWEILRLYKAQNHHVWLTINPLITSYSKLFVGIWK